MKENENIQMPLDHKMICNIIRDQHQGAIASINQADLAAVSGIRKRRVRKIIKELIEQFGMPIGTLYTQAGGYFWITTKSEAEVSCKAISDHAISQLSRVAALKKTTLRKYVGQLDLGT